MKVVIGIDGMSCGHCVAGVEKVLQAVTDVNSVAVSLEEKQAVIQAEKNVVIANMTQAIENAGFVVRNVTQGE